MANLPFPPVNLPSLPMPANMQQEVEGLMKKTIHSYFKNPTSEQEELMEEKVKEILFQKCTLKKLHHKLETLYDDKEEDVIELTEASHLDKVFEKINCLHEKMGEGKPLFEIEKEIKEHHPDLTDDEYKVFVAMVRNDGPYKLAKFLGMELPHFMEHLKCVGKKLK